jgi:hypothetical protein
MHIKVLLRMAPLLQDNHILIGEAFRTAPKGSMWAVCKLWLTLGVSNELKVEFLQAKDKHMPQASQSQFIKALMIAYANGKGTDHADLLKSNPGTSPPTAIYSSHSSRYNFDSAPASYQPEHRPSALENETAPYSNSTSNDFYNSRSTLLGTQPLAVSRRLSVDGWNLNRRPSFHTEYPSDTYHSRISMERIGIAQTRPSSANSATAFRSNHDTLPSRTMPLPRSSTTVNKMAEAPGTNQSDVHIPPLSTVGNNLSRIQYSIMEPDIDPFSTAHIKF